MIGALPIQQNGSFAPARIPSPSAWRPTRPPTLPSRLGQPPEAAAIARGADITFSVLTSGAAIVSGLALLTLVGMGGRGAEAEGYFRGAGRPTKTAWGWIGGIVALIGVANTFSSLSRASVMQAVPATPTVPLNPAPFGQTVSQ